MNFALILFIALLITGGIWLLDVLLLKRSRDKAARERMVEILVSIDGHPLSRWGSDGVLVAEDNRMVVELPRYDYPAWALHSMHLNGVSLTPLLPLRFGKDHDYVDRITNIVKVARPQ